MLPIVGALGLGLVWGWLAGRLLVGARWPLIARLLLWLVLQALIVVRLAGAPMLVIFLAGLALGALLVRAWLRGLALRYGEPTSGE